MFEDIIKKPKKKIVIPYARWYAAGCPEFDEYENGICSMCSISKKCICYNCPVMGTDCERCVDGKMMV